MVYTHAHEDHVGLFDLIPCDVPQYIGVGGQELMLAKYDLLKIAHEQEWKDSEEKSKILIDDEQKIREDKRFSCMGAYGTAYSAKIFYDRGYPYHSFF